MKIVIDRNGFKTEVTKSQLFALAADGSIGPETKVYVNERELTASRIQGIVFKKKDASVLNSNPVPDPEPEPESYGFQEPYSPVQTEPIKQYAQTVRPVQQIPVPVQQTPVQQTSNSPNFQTFFKKSNSVDVGGLVSFLNFKYFIIKPASFVIWWLSIIILFFASFYALYLYCTVKDWHEKDIYFAMKIVSVTNLCNNAERDANNAMDKYFSEANTQNKNEMEKYKKEYQTLLEEMKTINKNKEDNDKVLAGLIPGKFTIGLVLSIIIIYTLTLGRMFFELIYLAGNYYQKNSN